MPRSLLIISREDGRALKTYGQKKVRNNMKFSFIIGLVTGIFLCGSVAAGARILHDLKYLEYLNDLDRMNVELDDIHKQWPFHSIAGTIDDEDEDEAMPEQKAIDREKLLQVVNMARADLANKHNQNYRERLLEKLEDGFKHAKDASERANQLSQYRRYKPLEQEILEEARMYPERTEEEVRFDDDDAAYQNSDITFDEEDEEIPVLRPALPRPFFPRIAAMEKPIINYDNTFRDDSEEDADEQEEEEEEVLKPSFPKAYFPRIAPVDIPVNYKIDHLDFDHQKSDSDHNNHAHNEHEDYKFKEGEEFPHTIEFSQVPVVEDPSEFGVGPNDPRFYRDAAEQKEELVTGAPKQPDIVHPYLMKSSYVSKPKMNSRSDLQKQMQGINSDDGQLESFANKDVEVVPFKPDNQGDSAGVYIIAIVAGISAAATVGLIAVGIGWYNLQKHMKNAEDTDYPSYGIVGPNKDYEKKERDDAGDRRLAQSAQMYHYQHQKQQIIAMGRNPQGHGSQSDTEEEEDEEGNYTVYECPGLASIEGPLEVKNPMFDDDQLATPSQTPSNVTNADDTK